MSVVQSVVVSRSCLQATSIRMLFIKTFVMLTDDICGPPWRPLLHIFQRTRTPNWGQRRAEAKVVNGDAGLWRHMSIWPKLNAPQETGCSRCCCCCCCWHEQHTDTHTITTSKHKHKYNYRATNTMLHRTKCVGQRVVYALSPFMAQMVKMSLGQLALFVQEV